MVDEMYNAQGGEYELTGVNPNPRKHYSGRDIWFRDGDHVHGDQEDFLGLATSDKYVVHGAGPYDPCAEPEHLFVEIGVGLHKDNLSTVAHALAGLTLGTVGHNHFGTNYEFPAGVQFGGNVTPVFSLEGKKGVLQFAGVGNDLFPAAAGKMAGLLAGVVVPAAAAAICAAGSALGVIVTDVVAPVGHMDGGLSFGGIGSDVIAEAETFLVGLDLGGETTETVVEEYFHAGLGLGGVLFDVAGGDVEEEKAGVDFGAELSLDSAETEEADAGLAFGVEVSDGEPDAEDVAGGLQLGGDVEAIDDAPPTPGSDCASAAVISLGTDYSYTVAAPANHWFRFPVVGGTQYHVHLSLTGGGLAGITVQTGASCSGLSVVGPLNFNGDCVSFTPGSDQNCYIVAGAIGGPGATINYTIRPDLGPC